LIIASISVSIDSFFCGLSLTLNKGDRKVTILGVIISVLALCLIGSTLGEEFGKLLENYANFLSGVILILVGLSAFKNKNDKSLVKILNEKPSPFKQSLVVGFSVGLDGAVGCFSLTLNGYNGLMVALFITFVHALLLLLSLCVANTFYERVKKFKNLPSIILIALGLYKIIMG
jgi:putative Mn2+ efflux pump MntP